MAQYVTSVFVALEICSLVQKYLATFDSPYLYALLTAILLFSSLMASHSCPSVESLALLDLLSLLQTQHRIYLSLRQSLL